MPSETDLGSAALGGSENSNSDRLEESLTPEEMGQVNTEALVEDANREARGGMSFESEWAGSTVNSLREDLEAQLEFTKAHPETVDALITAAKADAFDTISNELGLFTKDFTRRPDGGEVKLRHAREAAEKARHQAYSNHVEAWKILQKAEDVYNRSLTFALQELVTGSAQRPYRSRSTGPGRNDFEIIGRHYDGPYVRAVIDNFLEKNPNLDQEGLEPK